MQTFFILTLLAIKWYFILMKKAVRVGPWPPGDSFHLTRADTVSTLTAPSFFLLAGNGPGSEGLRIENSICPEN